MYSIVINKCIILAGEYFFVFQKDEVSSHYYITVRKVARIMVSGVGMSHSVRALQR